MSRRAKDRARARGPVPQHPSLPKGPVAREGARSRPPLALGSRPPVALCSRPALPERRVAAPLARSLASKTVPDSS